MQCTIFFRLQSNDSNLTSHSSAMEIQPNQILCNSLHSLPDSFPLPFFAFSAHIPDFFVRDERVNTPFYLNICINIKIFLSCRIALRWTGNYIPNEWTLLYQGRKLRSRFHPSQVFYLISFIRARVRLSHPDATIKTIASSQPEPRFALQRLKTLMFEYVISNVSFV